MGDRLQEIKQIINSYEGTVKVVITRPQELIDDVNWLIEQAEKLEKLKNAYYANEFTVVDYLRTSSEVFEDKEIPTKKKRS